MNDFVNKSIEELQDLLAKAQQALKNRQRAEQADVIATIRKLAHSIGATAEISFNETPVKEVKRSGKVAPRYRNPDNYSETWTGRGIKPKWLQAYLNKGRSISEFLI